MDSLPGHGKKTERLCQVSLEKLIIKQIAVIENAMQNRITSDAVKEGCLQDDPHCWGLLGRNRIHSLGRTRWTEKNVIPSGLP